MREKITNSLNIIKWFGSNKISIFKHIAFIPVFVKTLATELEVFMTTSFLVGLKHHFPCFEPCAWARSTRQTE